MGSKQEAHRGPPKANTAVSTKPERVYLYICFIYLVALLFIIYLRKVVWLVGRT
jgi:hypothetical protein